MKQERLNRMGLATVLVSLSLAAGSAMADGLRNPPEGMTGLGKIGGKIVYNDDASTTTHNPANLVEQTNASAIVSVTAGYGTKEFTDQLGRKSKSEDNWSFLPNVFATIPVSENLIAGISLTTPFGRSTTFDKDGALRYTSAYYTELYAVNLNPNLAYKINDRVSVAAGVDLLYSELTLKQVFPWSLLTGTPDGESKIDADGTGLGYNAAITWNITDKQKAALTYRSSTKVDYDGDFKVSQKPPSAVLPFPLSLASDSSSFSTEIEFPAVLAAGYGIEITDRLRLEVNIEWIQHSLFDELPLDAENNQVLLPQSTIEADWDDNWTYGIGADYMLNENWVLRGGFIYLETPIPSQTMLPTIAEEDQGVISVGFGYRKGDHRFDAAYAYGLFDGRDVRNNDNPAFNGDYDFEAHLIGVSYGRAL